MNWTLIPLSIVLLVGCDKKADSPAAADKAAVASAAKPVAAPATSGKAAEAGALFQQRCATCHGATGKGDGPASAALDPKPRKYNDPEWQKSVTDEYLAEVIVKGGKAMGKSMMMPGNPDLEAKPELTKALVALIRSFGK